MATWDLSPEPPGYQYVTGTNYDDLVYGSIYYTDSMVARMQGGNDHVYVWSGYYNFVNGNQGSDRIEVSFYDEDTGTLDGAGGRYLGGAGRDRMYGFSGDVGVINGNNDTDYINGLYDVITGVFRGGKGDDQLIVWNGTVYGDSGSDHFIMTPPTHKADYAYVVDYTPGEDISYYAPSQGAVDYLVDGYGLWLAQAGDWTMLLAGINSLNQVNIVARESVMYADVI